MDLTPEEKLALLEMRIEFLELKVAGMPKRVWSDRAFDPKDLDSIKDKAQKEMVGRYSGIDLGKLRKLLPDY